MGRSIEFIMTREEEGKFIEFIRNNDIAIISPTSNGCSPSIIQEFHRRGQNIFWNKAYLAAASDINSIKMSYVKSCGHYIIEDTYEAPVIELRRSRDGISSSRLYAEICYYKEGKEIYKGEYFENLYKKIETWIKINYSVVEPVLMHDMSGI